VVASTVTEDDEATPPEGSAEFLPYVGVELPFELGGEIPERFIQEVSVELKDLRLLAVLETGVPDLDLVEVQARR
jgi:hypothetical protein